MLAQAETVQPSRTGLIVREATAEDGEHCGRIFYDAFESIAARHSHPIEPPSREFTRFMVRQMLAGEGFVGLVAERNGEVLGSAFVDERAVIAGIGPVTVDPAAQDVGVGRELMKAVVRREHDRGAVGSGSFRPPTTTGPLRSTRSSASWSASHCRSCRAPRRRSASPDSESAPHTNRTWGRATRSALASTATTAVTSFATRSPPGPRSVVECPGGICGYATGFGYGWHAVAETNEHLIALLAPHKRSWALGSSFRSRNAELLRWCLTHGLRIVQQSTLMTTGLYNEPSGSWLPSIAY